MTEDRPKQFRDVGAPWGAIVDGYQMIDTMWLRIDSPEEIDLEAFRQTHPVFANFTAAQAFELAQESIGELER